MPKITTTFYNKENNVATAIMSTSRGEIAQRAKCCNEDISNGMCNKYAGMDIAAQKCLIEYLRRQVKMFNNRLDGQMMAINDFKSWNSPSKNEGLERLYSTYNHTKNVRDRLAEQYHILVDDFDNYVTFIQDFYTDESEGIDEEGNN